MRFRLVCCLATVLGSLCLTAAPSLAAHRKAPFGFMGTVLDPAASFPMTQATMDGQMSLMARSGVESVRSNIYWSQTEPRRGVYDFSQPDKLVLGAARHGLSLLPIVEFTPPWAVSNPRTYNPQNSTPSNPQDYADFMSVLVHRYGPNGVLWKLYPSLRRYAVRDWQIWNEPAGSYDWNSQPWPRTYTRMLKLAYAAVHRADHGATVVCGALVGLNVNGKLRTPWGEADALYRNGARRYFDVASVNAFTNTTTPEGTAELEARIIRRTRLEMSRHGDGRKPIWITEITWPASLHKIPKRDYLSFETTQTGQQRRLSAFYRYVADHPSLGIKRIFWSTWATSYNIHHLNGALPTFAYSGLVRWPGGTTYHPLPILSTFRRTAEALEGCAKTDNASVCR